MVEAYEQLSAEVNRMHSSEAYAGKSSTVFILDFFCNSACIQTVIHSPLAEHTACDKTSCSHTLFCALHP